MDTVILNYKNYIINYLALTSKMHIMRFLDISATVKCFWEMVKRGIITIPQTKAETATNTDEDDLPF